MSLLETRNKKFNIPFAFIIGVIFLVGLAFFASYLESIPKQIKDVEVKEKIIQIRVASNEAIFVDGTEIDTTQLEEILKIQFDGYATPIIRLETAKNVSIEKATMILELARKQQYEVILETTAN
jgi:biopolymer transport protein ExbD